MFTLIRLLFLPVKLGIGTTKLGVKTGFRAGRLLGVRRLLVFGAGVGIGLLIAPTTGREMRARLQAKVDELVGGAGPDLAERVRSELSRSPRTWHLPQPTVEVRGSTAVLRGQVPHDEGRQELARVAAAVAGIVDVDNQVAVVPAGGTSTAP